MSIVKNIATLITGTTVAQAVPILISPILTRLYSPKDFGTLTLYMSISSIFAVIATMRYELAIIQPQNDKDAKAIVIISFFNIFLLSIITLILVSIYNFFGFKIIDNENIRPWLYCIPLSIILIGTFNVSNYYLLRKKSFKSMSNAKMLQGISLSSLQVSFAFFKDIGLILGLIFGQIISSLSIFFKAKKYWKKIETPSINQIKDNLKNYKVMPIYSAPGALADSLSQQSPVFFISHFFGELSTGLFGLISRILRLPSSLISASVSQVVYKKIIDDMNEGKKDITKFVFKSFLLLQIIYLPFVILIWFYGEDIFGLVFGPEWKEAGSFAKIIIIAVSIQFSVSPLSSILGLRELIKLGVIWQFTYLTTITITLFYFSKFKLNIFLWAYVIHECILYLFYLVLILKGSRKLEGIKKKCVA